MPSSNGTQDGRTGLGTDEGKGGEGGQEGMTIFLHHMSHVSTECLALRLAGWD